MDSETRQTKIAQLKLDLEATRAALANLAIAFGVETNEEQKAALGARLHLAQNDVDAVLLTLSTLESQERSADTD